MRTVEHELQKQDISEGKPLKSYINNSKTNTPQHTARELPARRELPSANSARGRELPARRELPTGGVQGRTREPKELPYYPSSSGNDRQRENLPTHRELPIGRNTQRSRPQPEQLPIRTEMPNNGANSRNIPERRELPTITERPIGVQTIQNNRPRSEQLPARREISASGTQNRREPEELPYYRSVSSNAPQRENLPARREMPKAGTQPKTPMQMYSEYGKSVRTPNVEEFNKLKCTGLDIDFNSYARQKLKTSPQSYETFMAYLKTGEPIKERFGNAMVYTNPQNFGEVQRPRPKNYVAANTIGKGDNGGGYNNYIIYTSYEGADFTAQAEYFEQQMRAEGKSVGMRVVNSREEFEQMWAEMPDVMDNVIIISHSNANSLIFPKI